MKYLNTFIKAKNLDKQMVMDYLGGKDPRKVYPLYHTPLVPTFAGSLDIFELKQLEKIKVETKQRRNGNSCMTGIAEWRVFSNAVRQITF